MADQVGTPAHAYRGAGNEESPSSVGMGMNPMPKAYGPYRHGQNVRQMTAEIVRASPESLASKAAREHQRRKKEAAIASAQGEENKVVVLDFCSRNTTVVVSAGRAAGAGSNERAVPGFVGSLPLSLPTAMSDIYDHRLLHAQIVSYEMSALLQKNQDAVAAMGDAQLQKPVYANATALVGQTSEQYALCITEQFAIENRNRVVELAPTMAVSMPLTLTPVTMLLRASPAAAAVLRSAYRFGKSGPGSPSGAGDDFYVLFTAGASHDYVPGLLFYLLIGAPLDVHALHAAPEPDGGALAFGASTPCFETVDWLGDDRLLCRRIGKVAGHPPTHQPFLRSGHTNGMRTQKPSFVFEPAATSSVGGGGGALRTTSNQGDDVAWLYWSYDEATAAAAHVTASNGTDDAPFDVVYRAQLSPQQPTRVHAYVPPPTSPAEVAAFVSSVTQIVRETADPDSAEGLAAFERVVYDGLTDTYVVNVAGGSKSGNAGFIRHRVLLGAGVSPLNVPLKRLSMLLNENTPEGKQRYANAALANGGLWVTIPAAPDNRLPVSMLGADRRPHRLVVAIPPGRWRLREWASLFQAALQQAASDGGVAHGGEHYAFEVTATRVTVDTARVATEQWMSASASQSRSTLPPPFRNRPYDVQAFVWTIRNAARHAYAFTLQWNEAKLLAAVLDVEPRVHSVTADTDFAWTSRLFSSSDAAVVAPVVRQWAQSSSDTSVPRAAYTVHVDDRNNTATLVQAPRRSLLIRAPPPPHHSSSDEDEDTSTSSESSNDSESASSHSSHSHSSHSSHSSSSSDGEEEGGCGDEKTDKDGEHCAHGSHSRRKHTHTPTVYAEGNHVVFTNARGSLPFVAGDVVWVTTTRGCTVTTIGVVVDAEPCSVLHRNGRLQRKLPLTGLPASSLLGDTVLLEPSPVGFNLHLHSAEPPEQSNNRKDSITSFDRVSSQRSAVSRWLGFRPLTRSDRTSYTADGSAEALVDEVLLLRIPELCTTGLSESRGAHYTQLSPFEDVLEEHYAILLLDRPRAVYRYDGTLTAGLATSSSARVAAAISQAVRQGMEQHANAVTLSGSMVRPAFVSFVLLRPDGTPYGTGGFPLSASLEVVYS